jgi:tetratricopeptide (TPR) repeat protein
MSGAISLDQAYKKISELIREEKWLEAHRACLEILHFDPENLKIIHYKNKIEKKVRKMNQKAIRSDIEALKPLWNEGKYEELLMNLKHLEPYINDYAPLKSFILKAQKKYAEKLRDQQKISYQQELKNIRELMNQSKFSEALRNGERLRLLDIRPGELKKTLQNIRKVWIDHELDANKNLLSGTKYEDILMFYQRLLKIDPDSEKLKRLIEQTKKNYQAYRIEEKKEFIYKSLEEIKTLYQLKKYEKAYEACGEILEYDPQNKIALNFQKRSAAKAQKLIDKEVVSQIIGNYKNLKTEYKTDKKNFVRM